MILQLISTLLRSSPPEQEAFFARQIPKGVFTAHQSAIHWIYDYRERHSVYPSVLAFSSRFPKLTLPKVEEPLATLTDALIDSDIFSQLTDLVDKGRELHESGRATKDVVAYFRRSVQDIRMYESTFVDLSLDPAASLRAYKDFVKRKSAGLFNPPSPWPTLNGLMTLFLPGELAVIAARTSIGKAQPLTSKVLTPSGFVPMGSLELGDVIVDNKGKEQQVTGVFPQGKLTVFRVVFSDGSSCECCGDHLWEVQNHHRKKVGDYSYEVRTLHELMASGLRTPEGRIKWNIPKFEGLLTANVNLPVNPWFVGAMIGNGCLVANQATFTSGDKEVRERFKSLAPAGVSFSSTSEEISIALCGFGQWLDRLQLHRVKSEHKSIPLEYLHAGYTQRFQLLQGLMDTDGYVYGPGFEYSTSSSRLALQVLELVRSLGAQASVQSRLPKYTYRGKRLIGQRNYLIRFTFSDGTEPFTCARHKARFKPSNRKPLKGISHVIEIGKKECQCISVTGNQLYVTDDYIVTHNTWMALYWANYFEQLGERVLFISKELPSIQVLARWSSLRFKFSYPDFRKGELSPRHLVRWNRAAIQFKKDDRVIISGNDTVKGVGFNQIFQKIQSFSPTVLVVDGAYLIYPEEKFNNDVQRFAFISSMLKRISMAYKLKTIAVVQAKREAEADTLSGVTKAGITHIYGADTWAQDSDWVIMLNGKRGASIRTASLEKSREGEIGSWGLDFKLHPFPCLGEVATLQNAGNQNQIEFTGV